MQIPWPGKQERWTGSRAPGADMRRGQSVSSDQQGMTSASLSELLQSLKEQSLLRQNKHPPLMQTETALGAGSLRSWSDWFTWPRKRITRKTSSEWVIPRCCEEHTHHFVLLLPEKAPYNRGRKEHPGSEPKSWRLFAAEEHTHTHLLYTGLLVY